MENVTINNAGAQPVRAAAALKPDLADAQRFLDLLDPTATNWTFQTFDDNADRKEKALARVFHGTLADHAVALMDLQKAGAGVFVTINETDGRGREVKNIVRVRALFADLDGAPLSPVTAWKMPDIIVDSSEGENWHAYWRVKGVALERFKPLQQMISAKFNADKSVNDLPRVLRLPGFYHQKIDQRKGLIGTPYKVRVIHQAPDTQAHEEAEFLDNEFAWLDAPSPAIPLSQQAMPAARFNIDTGGTGPRKSSSDYADILRRARTDGEKHAGVRELAAHLAGSGVKREMAEAIISEACPKWDDNVVSLITSAYRKYTPSKSTSPIKALAEDLSLVTDKMGRPFWNTANAVEILTHHEEWRGVLGFNEFTRRRMVIKQIPGSKTGANRNLEDDDVTAVLSWFNRNGFPKATATVAVAAVHAVARRNSFDPLADYLTGLSWDGTPRISEWLTRYCGAEASDYTKEAGRRWLISAAARAFKPGCKADHMLVLEGEQGAKKSSALAALAGEEWFSDALPPMNTKDASSYLRGRWIVEVAELEAMRREMDAVKAFISRQTESYRPAYGREEVDEPRRCVFAGTTNKDAWLRDETGGRRFWPVQVGEIDLDGIKRDRGQIWAEAVAAYKAGETWWLDGEVEAEARKEQSNRMADDPWLDVVADQINGRAEITIREIMQSMGFVPADMTRKDSDRIASLLKRQGWRRSGRATSGALKGQAVFTPQG